jgi:di/tripeptidase
MWPGFNFISSLVGEAQSSDLLDKLAGWAYDVTNHLMKVHSTKVSNIAQNDSLETAQSLRTMAKQWHYYINQSIAEIELSDKEKMALGLSIVGASAGFILYKKYKTVDPDKDPINLDYHESIEKLVKQLLNFGLDPMINSVDSSAEIKKIANGIKDWLQQKNDHIDTKKLISESRSRRSHSLRSLLYEKTNQGYNRRAIRSLAQEAKRNGLSVEQKSMYQQQSTSYDKEQFLYNIAIKEMAELAHVNLIRLSP